MTTLEKPSLRVRTHDEAIFVTADDRRSRRLRRATIVAAVAALLWVVGLGVGMLGFDSLPGVSLVRGPHAGSPVAPVAEVPGLAENTARALLATKAAAASVEQSVARSSSVQTARAQRNRAAKRAAAARAAHATAASATPAVNPAQRIRGWARRGNEAPPGQARRAVLQPPPAPATSQGRRVGQSGTTTPKPDVPPGQAKKLLDPPAPLPPPKKG